MLHFGESFPHDLAIFSGRIPKSHPWRERLEREVERRSNLEPLSLDGTDVPNCFLFRGKIYRASRAGYTTEEMMLQIEDSEERERRRFDRLRRRSKAARDEPAFKRERISEEVRMAVWQRDGGKCAKCGSNEFLEFDHIVPVSQGGSSTMRNVELLCERCNRGKGANVA
ncbi:MAG: HNH endonuclease [Elusimicrobia bacterium]|nr:HNH endonuclease [Elusimicrobiota bacterium]